MGDAGSWGPRGARGAWGVCMPGSAAPVGIPSPGTRTDTAPTFETAGRSKSLGTRYLGDLPRVGQSPASRHPGVWVVGGVPQASVVLPWGNGVSRGLVACGLDLRRRSCRRWCCLCFWIFVVRAGVSPAAQGLASGLSGFHAPAVACSTRCLPGRRAIAPAGCAIAIILGPCRPLDCVWPCAFRIWLFPGCSMIR